VDRLSDFIRNERERFETKHNNMFAFAFADIGRYHSFLEVILARHRDVGDRFRANTQALRESFKEGTLGVSPEQQALLNDGSSLGLHLQLETESFYLFAKILLDEVARSIEFYFGQARSHPLDSHDDLVKNIEGFSAIHEISLQPNIMLSAYALKSSVGDFRDYQIAHHKNPRTVRSHLLSPVSGPTMVLTSLYPTSKDRQVESRDLAELLGEINGYIDLVIELIESNRDKTKLKLEDAGQVKTTQEA
jgi:hypothetical protein